MNRYGMTLSFRIPDTPAASSKSPSRTSGPWLNCCQQADALIENGLKRVTRINLENAAGCGAYSFPPSRTTSEKSIGRQPGGSRSKRNNEYPSHGRRRILQKCTQQYRKTRAQTGAQFAGKTRILSILKKCFGIIRAALRSLKTQLMTSLITQRSLVQIQPPQPI